MDLGHQVDVISSEPFPELDSSVKLIKIFGLNLFEKGNHVTALRFKHLFSFTDFFEWLSMLTGGFAEPYTFGRRVLKYLKNNHADYDIIHDNQSLSYALISLKKKHILLKLSGESLMGNNDFGIDLDTINSITEQIAKIHSGGTKLSIVVGGGNIFRGI